MSESEISSGESERPDPKDELLETMKAAAEETPCYDPTTTERLLDAYRRRYTELTVTVREFLRLDEQLMEVEDDSEEAAELRSKHARMLARLLALTAENRCPGYGESGQFFDCDGVPGTRWTTVWCPECDERRRTRISAQLSQIESALRQREE